MLLSSVERCPECNYSLRGLPVRHRCPECGFEYDEETLIWRPRVPWSIFGVILPFSVVCGEVVTDAVSKLRNPVSSNRALILAAAVAVLAILGFMLLRLYLLNRRGRYVAITPAGIHGRGLKRRNWLGGLGESVYVPWERVVTVERHESLAEAMVLYTRDPAAKIDISYLFDSMHEAASFRDHVRIALQRHALRDPSRATPSAREMETPRHA